MEDQEQHPMGQPPTHAADVRVPTPEDEAAKQAELAEARRVHDARTAGIDASALPTPAAEQTPPPGFEPQVQQSPQQPGVYEQPGDLVTDADGEKDDPAAEQESGQADSGDDEASTPEPESSVQEQQAQPEPYNPEPQSGSDDTSGGDGTSESAQS